MGPDCQLLFGSIRLPEGLNRNHVSPKYQLSVSEFTITAVIVAPVPADSWIVTLSDFPLMTASILNSLGTRAAALVGPPLSHPSVAKINKSISIVATVTSSKRRKILRVAR